MIAIEEQPETVKISVYGELTLADHCDLEQTVTKDLRAVPKVRSLVRRTLHDRLYPRCRLGGDKV